MRGRFMLEIRRRWSVRDAGVEGRFASFATSLLCVDKAMFSIVGSVSSLSLGIGAEFCCAATTKPQNNVVLSLSGFAPAGANSRSTSKHFVKNAVS
jgi:hypothetical protein